MVVGLQFTKLTVRHSQRIEGDPFMRDSVITEIPLLALVQRVDGAEDSNTMQATETLQSVKVHVRAPKQPTVTVGDSFDYNNATWAITQVSSSLMEENVVHYLPIYWVFTAKRRQGRGN